MCMVYPEIADKRRLLQEYRLQNLIGPVKDIGAMTDAEIENLIMQVSRKAVAQRRSPASE